MISADAKVTSKGGTGVLAQLLEEISRSQVYVGIPEENAEREEGEITNPRLAFIHTHGARGKSMREEMAKDMEQGSAYSAAHQMYVASHGSPLYAIPPRPIIEPAIEAEKNKEPIAEELKAALKAFLDGKPEEAQRHLELAGQTGANAARAWFDDRDNGWPDNAPSTIKEKGSDMPLIDKGELRTSITYVVAKEER